jgi:HSP20 family protein
MVMYRRFRTPAMWEDMEQFRREMDRFYDFYYPRRYRVAPAFPAMNIWSSDEGFMVTAEIPGIAHEDIQVSVVNDTLTVSGERKPTETDPEARYHRQERGSGKFSRSIELPCPVDPNNVEASFKDGVLHISLPRKEAEKPKKIVIKTA